MTIVQRECIPDQVRRWLTERILSGEFKPGDRLVELQIAKELGTSQGPVREALRELEAARLVESEPHRGTRVRKISNAEVRDTYITRGILEEGAARIAAPKFQGNADSLRSLADSIIRSAEIRNFGEQSRCNAQFHREIVSAAENQTLLRIWESLLIETRTWVRLNNTDTDVVQEARTHLPIVDALDRGDGLLAGRLLREHAESFAPPPENT